MERNLAQVKMHMEPAFCMKKGCPLLETMIENADNVMQGAQLDEARDNAAVRGLLVDTLMYGSVVSDEDRLRAREVVATADCFAGSGESPRRIKCGSLMYRINDLSVSETTQIAAETIANDWINQNS